MPNICSWDPISQIVTYFIFFVNTNAILHSTNSKYVLESTHQAARNLTAVHKINKHLKNTELDALNYLFCQFSSATLFH